MALIIGIIISIFLLVLLVKFISIKQSFVYLVLWLFAALSILFNPELLKLFGHILPVNDFGVIGGKFLSSFFFVFAALTIVHQFFLYYFLHNLETETDKWEKLYPGFYNSIFEKSVRIVAFLLLLMTVDKIPFLKSYLYSYCSVNNRCSESQLIILSGSSILFFLLFIYDCVGGIWCRKWDRNHWMHTSSDFIPFVFWGIIAYKLIIQKEESMGNLAFVPLIAGSFYLIFLIFRIVLSIYKREIR